jgi:hypothetical protein
MVKEFFQNNISNRPKLPDALKSEHLKKDAKPIIACIGTIKQFLETAGEKATTKIYLSPDDPEMQNIDYYGDPAKLAENQHKNAGYNSYVISAIDSLDKISKSYMNCTGLIVTGQDRKTGEDVSFLSHQDPKYFLKNRDSINQFSTDLSQRIKELKDRCIEGTIDAAVFGGNYFQSSSFLRQNPYAKKYIESVKLIAGEVTRILGFEPAVITGPKLTEGSDDIFYNNKERHLHIIRPEAGSPSSDSYAPGDIDNQKKKWYKDT